MTYMEEMNRLEKLIKLLKVMDGIHPNSHIGNNKEIPYKDRRRYRKLRRYIRKLGYDSVDRYYMNKARVILGI